MAYLRNKLPKPRSSSSLVIVTKSNDTGNIRIATTFFFLLLLRYTVSITVTKVQYDFFLIVVFPCMLIITQLFFQQNALIFYY
jgi:hypothetical protein